MPSLIDRFNATYTEQQNEKVLINKLLQSGSDINTPQNSLYLARMSTSDQRQLLKQSQVYTSLTCSDLVQGRQKVNRNSMMSQSMTKQIQRQSLVERYQKEYNAQQTDQTKQYEQLKKQSPYLSNKLNQRYLLWNLAKQKPLDYHSPLQNNQ